MGDTRATVTLAANMDISNILGQVKAMQGAFNGLKINPNLTGDITKEFGNLQKLLDDYRKALDKGVTSKGDIKNLEKLEKAINSSFSKVQDLYKEFEGRTLITKVDSSKLDELKQKTEVAKNALNDAFNNVKFGKISGVETLEGDLEKAVARSKTLKESFQNAFSGLKTGDINQFTNQIDKTFDNLSNKLKSGKLEATADNLIQTFQRLGFIKVDINTSNSEQKIAALQTGFEALKNAISNGLNGDELKVLVSNLETATKAENEFRDAAIQRGQASYQKQVGDAKQLAGAVKEGTAATREFQQQTLSATQQVEQLQQSTQYFFSLRNMINLLKRGVREAVDTVKELDAAMTETAVVTKFSVGDMWAKLPEYTANANALGATVQDMYEATTLYYQQGLNAEQAMSIASETMKMARIGGLEAAEATDMMTAALRGFNMELNETSAQRINDVYSNLAAKTASNTEELGTAMQRTASIAASAGMSFEGTAAFLAQAIETTREPAENLGTAMKTIVARFQELKKNPLEMSEVDGETVDYNKVDAALKTIGVDLKDTNGQFRDLDQVFLDISQRWDSLTQTQQRYIATTAAGSRQQSRFIAMMSNYERTQELMSYANDSSGASNEQFGKTLDSLEAKLNKFQNAWKQFLMNIMNDSWTKSIVTGATTVLNTVNKLIDSLSFGKKGIKSALSLFTAFMGLKVAGRGANILIGGLGGLVDPQSSVMAGLKGGALGGQAARISNPIVQAIHGLIPHIDKAAVTKTPYKYQDSGNYNKAREALNAQLGGYGTGIGKGNGKYNINQLQSIFDNNQLNKQQQKTFFQASPGIKKNLTNSLSQLFTEVGMNPKTSQGLISGFKKGTLALDEVLDQPQLRTDFNKRFEEIGKEGGWAAQRGFYNKHYNKLFNEGISQGMSETEAQSYAKKGLTDLKVPTKQVEEFLQKERELTKTEKLSNAFGKSGAAISSMGASLQMLGSQIATVNPALGEMVSNLGNVLMAAGSIPNMFASLIAGGPAVWAITAAVTALGVAWIHFQNKAKNIRKIAEDISSSFEETNKQAQNNIATLQGYQAQMAVLSKGVDINGNNVSLSNEDYAQYLEMVDKIAEINPEIVQGYNAQGHAIIDNNKALAETLDKLKEMQNEALKTYVDSDSLQALINARNIDKSYKSNTQMIVGGQVYRQQGELISDGGKQITTVPLGSAVRNVALELKKQKGFDESILKNYGIESLQALQEGDDIAVKNFVKHRDEIETQVSNAVKKSNNEIKDSVRDSFADFDEQQVAFEESVAPVVQNLQTYASNLPAFKNIGPEFQSALMSGLKDIAIQPNLDASQMQSQARVLIQEFDNLTAEGSSYANAMSEVETAQEKFAQSLDAAEYTKGTENALNTLNTLMEQYAGKTDAYSQAIAEYLQNQMDRIRNFTEEGGGSITEAINGVISTVSAAEGAYDSFKESTKTDLSTGVDSMRSIFEEVTKETDGVALHMEKFGDGTMWKGARALLGDKFVEENADNIDVIKNEIRSLETEMQQGEKGFAAFWDNFKQVDDSLIAGFQWNEDGSYSLDRDVNPDAYKQIAEQMHRSEEYVVAMLNAGRQFADIDFSNTDDVRTAFATDNATIKNGNQVFVKSDYLNNALDEAQIYNPNERNKRKAQYEEAGIIEVKAPDVIEAQDFMAMGIKDLGGLIKSFGDTGQYTRDEIQQYAEALGESGLIDYKPEDFADGYNQYLEQLEHPELEPVQSIESTVGQIANLLAKDQILNGKVSQDDEQAAKDFHHSIYGNEGYDTEVQQYGLGHNEQGNVLTPAQVQKNRNDLEEARKIAEGWADVYEQGAKAAAAGSEEQKRLQAISDSYREDAEYIAKKTTAGDKTWTELYAQNKAEEQLGSYSGIQQTEKYQEIYNKALEEAQQILDGTYDGSLDGLTESAEKTEIPNLIQDQITAINEGFNGLLSSVTPESINTPEAQQTLSQLYQAVLGDPATLTTDLMSQMQTLGINVEEAIASGLVVDPNKVYQVAEEAGKETAEAGVEGNANGQSKVDTTSAKNTGTEKGKETSEAGVEGNVEGQSGVDTTPAKSTGAEKGKETAEAGVEGNVEGQSSVIPNSSNQTNHGVPTETQQELLVNYTGKIANPEELKSSIEQQLKTIFQSLASQTQDVQAKGSIKVDYSKGKQAKASNQKAVVNYTKGSQDKASDQSAKVNYTLGSQAAPLPKSTSVNYTLGSQASPKPTTVDISPHFVGSWTKTITLNTGAKGINNKISTGVVPQFGSLAKGRYGTIGPRNKGGLTLTGEKGFEIAWLPSENKSMILGAKGPQLLNLPSDAVVYTHEQSKKIIKQKAISAGSMDGGSYDSDSTTTITKSNNNKNNNGKKDKVTEKEDKNADNAAKVIAKAGWVQVWWENMTRRIDATQKKVDDSLSLFEKKIKTFGTTVSSIKGTVDAYKKNLQRTIALNKNEVTQAQYELKRLANGNNFYTKKEVSYEVTKKEDGKESKETKKMNVLLSNFIHYNKTYGTYEISQQAIDKIALGGVDSKGNKIVANQSLAQAIKDAAEKEINERNNRLKTAQDNIKKAQEALEKLSNDIYETFYKWEKSINKVYVLSQKLEMLNNKLSISSAKVELQFSKMEAGAITAAEGLSRIKTELSNQETTLLNKATASRENLSATKKAFQDSLTVQPYLSNLLKNPDSTTAKNDLLAAKKAFTFLDTVNLSGDNFDYNKALSYLNTQQISKDEYDAIKGVLDGIFEKQKNYLDAQEQSYQSINEIYQTMEEYQSFIADFEKSLLSSIEEQAEQQVKKLDKLNSSLSKAYKDLIDEVKQKLDDRRKTEDNAKTESDIAKKQQRLAALRADTGGGNAIQIAQLEKEIADAQQNYQRSLEDQLIEKLQRQGDEAEKQRQHQIDLLNIQNEIARETGSNLAQVKEWLKSSESVQAHYEDIRAAWLSNNGYDKATDNDKIQLEQQFEVEFAKYQGYSAELEKYDTMIEDLQTIEESVDTIATEISMDRPSYTAGDMKAKGYSAYSLKLGGYGAKQLVDAGYNPKDVKAAGYTAEQFASGYKSIINNPDKSAEEQATARQQGISAMHQAGYSNNDIAKQFGAQSTMQQLNASGKTVQSALGNDKNATAKYLQTQIVNKGGKNISQSDMDGVQVNIVTPDKKTVLAAIKGSYAYGHYGSTLYTQKWDSKTGTLTGKPAKYSISGMTPEVMKLAGWEGMAALEYAIKTQQWGSIINKKFKQLTAAAGINGKEYTLGAKGHNWSASVGGDGLIYQNVKEGVAKWDPATGKTWVEKYNKQHFIEVAKRNNGPSREYAQVLKAKGITKYATGGLANYTGPAWLDGTPSKPELVLNAQDTKNFIALKDILSKAMSSAGAVSNSYAGDATYEININVDHISSDYDVDKMAERVKKIIVKDSSYRNVTQVRKFR